MEFASPGYSKNGERDPYFVSPPQVSGSRVHWPRQRAFLMAFSVAVLLYSLTVLIMVAWMGDIGVRCVFSTDLKDPVSSYSAWTPGHPRVGDVLVQIGSTPIANYTDYVRAAL